ncbi:MAG: hypothetical protein IJS60_10905 [Abditibacteriota bacterium]|nr:hypothetical protein [Abditibacteriota bacterium]
MIDITNINAEFEGEALWLEINIYSDKDQDILSELNVFLNDGEEEQSVYLDQKLSLGDNIVDLMFPVFPKPWYPQGCGPLNVYEIYAEVKFEEEIGDFKTFVGYKDIDYHELSFFNQYPELFGVSLNMVSVAQIEFLAKAGINTVYTNDRRREIVDFCNLKGIFLLFYQAPTCKINQTESFRKEKKTIIYDFKEIKDPFVLKKLLKPVYVGCDFISNNTNQYVYGVLKQGVIYPDVNEIEVLREEKIRLEEFSTAEYEPIGDCDTNLIKFSCLYSDDNIVAKHIEIGDNVRCTGEQILVSRFQLSESVWEVILSSNEFIPNLHIETEQNISDNDFSIFPGETVRVTFTGITDGLDFKLTTN